MAVTEERKQRYIVKVHEELKRRGFTAEEISILIGKTGFMSVMRNYPEEQMHYAVEDCVDEILITAAKTSI
jgi:hypothetical protein